MKNSMTSESSQATFPKSKRKRHRLLVIVLPLAARGIARDAERSVRAERKKIEVQQTRKELSIRKFRVETT